MPDPQSPTVDETLHAGESVCALCGSTWNTIFRGDGPHAALESSKRVWYCSDGRHGDKAAIDAEITRRKSLRSQPAPVPTTESEFKVGEFVEGLGAFSGTRRSGWLLNLDHPDGPQLRGENGGTPNVTRASLRRLSPPAPEATVTAAPVAKVDPYAEHRAYLGGDPVDHSHAKRARFTADTLRDLDRPLSPPRYPNRYACVGVMGDGALVKRREVRGHPRGWPSNEGEEP